METIKVNRLSEVEKSIEILRESKKMIIDLSEAEKKERESIRAFIEGAVYSSKGTMVEDAEEGRFRCSVKQTNVWVLKDLKDDEIPKPKEFKLESEEEKYIVADLLIKGHKITFDLSTLSEHDGKLVFDFLSGVLFMLYGNFERTSDSVFIGAPELIVLNDSVVKTNDAYRKLIEMILESRELSESANTSDQEVIEAYEACRKITNENDLDKGVLLEYAATLLNRNHYERSIEIAMEYYTWAEENHVDIDKIKNIVTILARGYSEVGRNEEAERYYRQLMTMYHEDEKEYPWVCNGLANVLLGTKRSKEAVPLLKMGLKQLEKRRESNFVPLSALYYNLVQGYINSGLFWLALYYINKAMRLAELEYDDVSEAIKQFHIIKLKQQQAEICETKGKNKKALSILESIEDVFVKLCEEDPQKNVPLARFYSQLGLLYDHVSRYDRAELVQKKAIHLYEGIIAENPLLIHKKNLASVHVNQGATLLDMGKGNIEKARDEFKAAASMYEEMSQGDVLGFAEERIHVYEFIRKSEKRQSERERNE